MIDLHTHLLPKMDDGSKSIAESRQLLQMLSEQGVTAAVATPHFYANEESAEAFLERRQISYESLCADGELSMPLLLGAEVLYYNGISKLNDLQCLCIGGSKLLLLEMPIMHWTEYTVRELLELSGRIDVRIVLAHVERYLHLQSASLWDGLLENGVLMQVNASFFVRMRTRRLGLNLLREHRVQFLGSDCHDLKDRKPRMEHAATCISKAFGGNYLQQMSDFASEMLQLR